MAVTRINNNQISDASAGNVYVGINAAVKLQNYSVTSQKIANNLVYGSDLTVAGNLTVQGNTTAIDTTYTTVEDPVILLASGQTGVPTVDIGFIGQRGTSENIAFVWDESASEFITAFTTTGETNTTVSIASYTSFHTGNANIGGNMVVNGTSSFVGNIIGTANVTANIAAGNILTNGQVSAAGNITANYYFGNGSQLTGVTASTSGFPVTAGTSNIAAATNGNIGVTVAGTSNVVTFASTGVYVSGIVSASGNIVSAANISGGNLLTGGLVSSTGNITSAANITGGNLLTSGIASAASYIGSVVSVTANVTGGNLLTGGLISAASNITGGNLLTGGLISSTGNITSAANISSGNIISTALVQGATVSATGNVVAGNVNVPGGNVDVTNFINAGAVLATGRVEAGTTMSAAGNITGANLITSGLVTATGNIRSTANVLGGNLVATTAVVTPTVIGTTVTVSSTGGLITLAPSSNVSVSSKNINNLAQPVQDQDAATKLYVDNMVTTQVAYHQAVFAATTGTLETATGGTITYSQPNGAGNGVGATLTVAGGTFNLIDTANIQTANTRVLVKNQANGVLNGIYYWANATALVRTTDADEYGPNSSEQFSINDYFFVQSGNVNAGSAWIVDSPSGTITFGTSNIQFAQFSSSQVYSANTQAGISLTGTVFSAKVDNNTTAFDVGGNIIVKASANLTTPNIGAATGTSLSVTGNLTGQGANISGNVSGGNLLTGGIVSSTGNITSVANISGGNLLTSGIVSAASHIGSVVSVSGNVTGGNILTGGLISSTGNITSAANISGGNLLTGGLVSSTGNITSAANITGGNILTSGLISSTGNITSAANVAGGNLLATTTVSAASHIGSVVSVTGNVTGGNILTGGLISSTGNITSAANISGGNLLTGGLISSTGNITSAANITGGNILTSGLISATGNITGGNVNTTSVVGTAVVMSGNITGANLNTGGSNGLILNGSNINSNAARITINQIDADVDFAVDGSGAGNVFYVDAGTRTVSFGSSTQTTNAIVAMNATNSFLMPVGTTPQRPGVGVTGMLRFNSSLNAVEVYDNSAWATVGTPSFTVISDQQFNGDGSTVAFTLATAATTNSVIVSINGVIQIPTLAYSVTTTTLTFTEAPQSGDLIDVRTVTTTTSVTSISNSPGNAIVGTNATQAIVEITGNLNPTANVTYSLGNSTARWKDLYLSGNSLYIGNIIMKNVTGNTVAFYAADGTTPATIDSTNVDTTTIANGTSSVSVIASGGNIRANVGGSTIALVYSGGANITGVLAVSGNIVSTGSNGVANIGSATTYFNTVHAKATSAQYADLAENYVADAAYEPGTVLSFGGANEVTLSAVRNDRRVAGVVSTNPSYIMNAVLNAEHVATVALTGRVPTKVSGPVAKGDMMVSAGDGRAIACATPALGTVIGKALQDNISGDSIIEVVVGRM